jgi:restriction system protein
LERDPSAFYSLDPFKFEEVVAELFAEQGYEIQLTGKSWDGGVDFFAIKRDLVSSLYVVQCKRYKRERKVGVSEVRELYAVKNSFAATKGLLATTSFYSKPARLLEEKHKWELELKDYNDLLSLLDGRSQRRDSKSPNPAARADC